LKSGIHIFESSCIIELLQDRHALLRVRPFIGQFDTSLDAVEQRGGNGEKTILRVAVGNGTNMTVDAEDFLDDDEAGDRVPGGACNVGIQFVAVAGSQYCFAHEHLVG
jgi:hypothetical protein